LTPATAPPGGRRQSRRVHKTQREDEQGTPLFVLPDRGAGVDAVVDAVVDAGADAESPALPSASIDPSVAAISGKQRFRDIK